MSITERSVLEVRGVSTSFRVLDHVKMVLKLGKVSAVMDGHTEVLHTREWL